MADLSGQNCILTIDTTMNGCSVGLYDVLKDKVIAEQALEMSRGQAEQLIPMIEGVLSTENHTYQNLSSIAVTKGPGAFTGMRIGLATAKSLGMALDIPVVGVCTFRAVLETYRQSHDASSDIYAVLMETKRQDYYCRRFDKKFEPVSEAEVITAAGVMSVLEGEDCVLIGDAEVRFRSEAQNAGGLGFADVFMPSPLAIARIACSLPENERSSEPVYIRAPEIGVSKKIHRKLKTSV